MQTMKLPNELKRILAQPGTLSGPAAQQARALYSDSSICFHPHMLSEFGMAVFTGDINTTKIIHERDHPNLTATETCFEWGYISLALFGSQRIEKGPPGMEIAHAKVIIHLLLNGAPVDIADVSGSTALHHVAYNNRVADVLKAIFSGHPDSNARDRYGCTPLLYAVMQSQAEVVALCLANGGDLSVADGDGVTPSGLLIHASPAVAAIVAKYNRERQGTSEPLEDKEKCVVCGKIGGVKKCARCRLTRYCGQECQRIHWDSGHKAACIPFDDVEATITLKISRAPFSTSFSTAYIRREVSGIPDGEEIRRAEAASSQKGKGKKGGKELHPSNVFGKTVIVKVQLPMGESKEMMVYNKTKDLTCRILPDGQPMEYARLEKKIRDSGWMGLKGYFMAEVGDDILKIKVKEILANQPCAFNVPAPPIGGLPEPPWTLPLQACHYNPRLQVRKKDYVYSVWVDAGGARGISQLKILAELMHRLNFGRTKGQELLPCDVFDMIGGSGSGGFIAILLVVLGLNVEQALEEFIDLTAHVLERQGVEAPARTAALQVYIGQLLEKHDLTRNIRLMDPGTRSKHSKIVIPILNKRHIEHALILRNFESCQGQALNFSIAEAILATLASPPLFTATSISDAVSTSEYISGDLKLSNSIRMILSEAYETLGKEARVACLLSIGCGHHDVVSAPGGSALSDWNQFLESLVKDSEQTATEIGCQTERLGLYHRFSVTRGLERDKEPSGSGIGDAIVHTAVYLSDIAVTQRMDTCVDALTARDGIVSLDQLTHSGGQNVTPPKLPPLTRTFVMRKEPWEFLEKALFGMDDSGDVEGPRMLAVTGMGGCGKTQLILKFLRVHRVKFELCLFVDGSSVPSIRADIMRHVRSLNIAHSQKAFEECLFFLSHLSLAGQRMIVYDNVDDPHVDLAPLLPTGESCTIIVTSRNRLLGNLCPESHLELDVMSMEEAIDLLLYSADHLTAITEQARKDAGAIAQALGCLPIALQQARSYMSQTKCSARAYLDRLIDSRDELLTEPAKFQLDMGAVSTYAAFETSFKKLSLHSQKFLRLLSYFHWSKFPIELIMLAAKYKFSEYRLTYAEQGEDFHKGKAVLEAIFLRDGRWSVLHLDKMMIELQNYSLISSTPGVDTILAGLHPLAHGWLQSCIPEHEVVPYRCAAVLLLALGSRDEYTPSVQYLTNHIIHLSALWDHLHINNAEAFAHTLDRGGASQGALKLRERVLGELRTRAEPETQSVVNSMWSLALTYRNLGRHKDAEPLKRETRRLMTKMLGERHPHTITASSNLALTYRDLGRLKEAEALQEQVLELRKEILGERHPDTIMASNNLALTYCDLGRLKEAEALQEEVLELRKEILGGRHPDTIAASSNLALTYCELGRLKEAEVLQEVVLKLRKEILGERHPGTIMESSNLADTYHDLGRLKEAEALQEEVQKLRKDVLGGRHPDTIASSNNLAYTYRDLGRLKEAEALQLDTLKRADGILGREHPTTTISMLTMAEIYESHSKKLDALTLLDEAGLIIAGTQGKSSYQYREYQKIRIRVEALAE